MTNQATTVRIDAHRYEDEDDCLAAASRHEDTMTTHSIETTLITIDDIAVGLWRDIGGQEYRAAYVNGCVLTGPEHAALTDAELVAEAGREADRGKILGEDCVYCDARVRVRPVPAPSDTASWARIATDHEPGCNWILTRAHTRPE